jgi:hypothetical protein
MSQLLGGNSSSSGTSSSNSSSALDPEIKKLFMENFSGAQNVAKNLQAQTFAPRTGDYNAGEAAIRAAATNGPGLSTVNTAANTATGLQSSNPYMVTGKGYDPIYGNAAQLDLSSISNYMNPYTQSVIDTTMSDLARQRQMQGAADNASAVKAGAFGGSRQAVQNALTNEAYDRNTASTVANLRNTGYNTALGAAQSDVANRQAAMLANLGFGNQAAQFGANATNTAELANQGAYANNQNLKLNAANLGNTIGTNQQSLANQNGQNLMNLGLMDQEYQQKIMDATRNLPLEQQAIINQALGINPAGGSGMTSNATSVSQQSSKSGSGLLGLGSFF